MKLLLLVWAAMAALALPARADVSGAERALTVVVTATSGTQTVVGSGVVIGLGIDVTIVTAAHVVPAGFIPAVRAVDGTAWDIRSIERVPGHDLALIRASAPVAPVRVALLGRVARDDGGVFLWGHPSGQAYVLARGLVLDLAPNLEGGSAGRFTIACPSCEHGDSGAGVFDARGRLIGILIGLVVDTDGHRTGVSVVESISSAAAPRS